MTNKNERHTLCPFRRTLVRSHKRTAQGEMQETYTDRFGHCAGTSCMAYKNGHCLRLEKPKEL